MANEHPNSSSSPSTIPNTTSETPEKSAPPTVSETLISVPQEDVAKTTSRQLMSRRRRAGSRTNRDDRRHQVRRYRTGGSTYRPNYDAPPERRREYREYPERSWELEPTRQEPYQEYSTTLETNDRKYNQGYLHDDHTWERRPAEYRDYYDNRQERTYHRLPEYSRAVSPRPTSQPIHALPASTRPLVRYDYDPRAYRTLYPPSSDRSYDYYMDRQRRPLYDYSRHYHSPPRHDYYYDNLHPITSAHGDNSEGYCLPIQNNSGYIGYQSTNPRAVGSHSYHFRYPEEISRRRDRSPCRPE